ncbi:MAG: hypothetical protein V5A16_02665, partial [Haloplanus sp.]
APAPVRPAGHAAAGVPSVTALSPLTYFSRGVRAATSGGDPTVALLVLAALATGFFLAGAAAVPKTE